MTTRAPRLVVLGLLVGLLLVPAGSRPQGPDPAVRTAGQTATLLPDGRWLLVGGVGTSGPAATAAIWDPTTRTLTPVAGALTTARAWHTATVLPDGTVLVLGGVGADGRVVQPAEAFDPATQTFTTLALTSLMLRAHHTATLLTEGQVLIAGGVADDGTLVGELERWDPATQTAETVGVLQPPRQDQTATLLPSGTVLFWGGRDAQGAALTTAALYDPVAQTITPVATPPSPPPAGSVPELVASLPEDGATIVPVDGLIALRFSGPLRVETITPGTVTLVGPEGTVAVSVVPAEGGLLAFVTPQAPLLPSAAYTLALDGLTDAAGMVLPFTTLHFTTAVATVPAPAGGGSAGPPDGASVPGPGATPPQTAAAGGDSWEWTGERRDGQPYSPWQALPPLSVSPGVTALAGQVLQLDGEPLAHVTLEIARTRGASRRTTRTDDTGRFLLTQVPAGHQELLIDGQSASRPDRTYGVFEVGVDLVVGQTTVLPYTIWLPQLDTANAVTIPSPTTGETVVTTPRIPGLEVHLPPGTVIRDHEGKVVTALSLTPIPLDRPPFPLPRGVAVPFYFTLQPGAAYLTTASGTGAWLVYPNVTHTLPGTRFQFWNYDPEERGWYVYGLGTVPESGAQVVPDPGVTFYEVTGAMVADPGKAPPEGPAPGNPDGPGGDPVDLATGLFVVTKTDLVLQDVLPVVLTRTYRPRDTVSRAFGLGATHPYDWFLVGTTNPYTYVDLILPDGGRVHYDRISPGTSYLSAVYEHVSTPTRFYKSRIIPYNSGWRLTLLDGTRYDFRDGFQAARPMQGGLLAIEDRFGNRLSITRNAGGDATRITTPNGRSVDLTVDASHRITQLTDALGRVVRYTYDGTGRLTTVTDPAGGVTTYTYDSLQRMLTLRDARGLVYLTNAYDTGGRVTQQTQADGTTYQFTYTLDGNGKITQVDLTDPRGFVRRVTVNAQGYVLTNTLGLGQPEAQTTTFERQAGTQFVTARTDALGRRTESTYDAQGHVTSVTRLAGTGQAVTTTYTYEPTWNQVTSVTDPLGHTTSFGYNTAGALTSVTDPLGRQTTLTVNTAGQPTAIIDPLSQTTQFGYQGGDLVTVTDPLGHATQRSFDAAGRLVGVTDPLGRPTSYLYDPLNRLRQVVDPGGGETDFAYDPNGNLLSVMDARGNVTGYAYNTMDRLTTRTDPLQHAESYTYDANGNLTQVTDRKGQGTTFTSDALNRRTQASYGDSTTSYTYDAGNRLTQVADSLAGAITRSYDGLDRLLAETTPQGAVSYTYDAVGRRTTMTVAGQQVVTYTYDNADRLTQLTQGAATVAMTYDLAGRRTSLTLPNGIVTESSYDAASRLTGLTYKLGATVVGTLTYTSDAAGARTQVGGSWARTGWPQAISTASYNGANQQLGLGGSTMTYDPNGNLTTRTEGAGATTYTWDARNRLTGLAGPATTASFGYDALGRRWTKTINGARTDFLYDGLNPAQEGVLPTTVSATLLTGLGIDEYFTRTDATGTNALLTDALGSTLALTDPGGAVTTEYAYEPFGATTVTGAPSANPFQYTGRENDGTGLYSYRARYYHPGLGRFIAEDPIEFLGGDINLYAYVYNNPGSFLDPVGLLSFIGGGGVSAVAGKGVEASAGGYYDSSTGEVGTFVSVGGGAGVNVSGDIFVGAVSGDVRGVTVNVNVVVGPVSGTVMVEPSTGKPIGGTVGLGPVIPGIPPVGGSVTVSVTGKVCLRNCSRPKPPCLACRKP